MDWNLFWTAFGAIGTTLGSLITALAVVIAVKQYKQPLNKIVKVEMCSAVSCDELGNPLEFYCIIIKNKGIRTVQINSINIQGKKKVLWLNNAQFDSNAKINLPIKIEPEESKDFLFEVNNFKKQIKKAVVSKAIGKNQRLVVFVTDSVSDKYYCKTNMRISSLIKTL